ncbi:MAG: sigma-70 family RNA polymerase sigma factor [Bacteroidota bacterium]
MEERDLIAKLKTGDQEAFKLLVTQYQNIVLNTCLGFVPNLHDAEDLVQEVFIEVFRSINKFKAGSKLSTWVYRIAVNKSLELIRSRKRAKRNPFFKSLIGLEDYQDTIGSETFYHPGFELENQERAKVLYNAIDSLAENQRTAFTLHKMEGLSYQEISGIMEVSLSSVESLIFRARRNLKKKLENFYKNDR